MQYRLYSFFLLCFISFLSLAQSGIQSDSIWVVNNYRKIEKIIPMRDGVKLFTAIYLPKDSLQKFPLLIVRTPYSCKPYGEKNYKDFWNSFYMNYCREQYILVFQDVRGRYMSEGEFVDIRPFIPNKKSTNTIDEASDTYDTIDWLVKNIHENNGKAGVFGISYPGFYSTMAALSGHPALKAVSPQAPVTDWFMGDDFHHNGAFMLMDAFEFYKDFGIPRPFPLKEYAKGFDRMAKEPNAYKFYLESGSLPAFTHQHLGDSIAFWNALMKHPNYDKWWKARNVRNFIKDIKPAMLVVGGLFDAEDCFGAWNLYKSIEKNNPTSLYNKIVMGPWHHGAWGSEKNRNNGDSLGKIKFGSQTSEWYRRNIEFNFFQYFLKGIGNAEAIKEASVFFSGENTWKQFSQWPSKKVLPQSLYLQSAHGLSFMHPPLLGDWQKPDTMNTWSGYISDPSQPVPHEGGLIDKRTKEYMVADQRYAGQREDVLFFVTDTLQENITLAGPLLADLMVSTSSTDADFIVKLIDVFPDNITERDTLYKNDTSMNGYQMLIRGEVIRGKYRNSFENPEPFVPNKITRVKFTLPDIAHTFLKGHKIMVQIQSSWFPLVDRNPQKFMDIYHAAKEDFQKASIRIYHTDGLASRLILPVLQQD